MTEFSNKATGKSVLSCDTIVVVGQPVGGPPPERQITLAGIMGPRLGRRDNTTKDEPFAWPAREFVRNLVVGKPLSFDLEETSATINKSFGVVMVGGQNLAHAIVAAGWAKVKPAMGNSANSGRTDFEELSRLEAAAQAAGLGMWSKEPSAGAATVRQIIPPSDYDAKEILEACKGVPQPFLIEQLRDGATLRGFMLPSFRWITVFLSGVSCPGFKRAETQGEPDIPDAFAVEARYFVEHKLLNREVQVLLEGVDKYNNFYGTIVHPMGNISVELLKVGLAKVVDWSAKFSRDAEQLYKGERLAKERRLRIWKDYVPPQRSAASTTSAEYPGRVVEVISGDFMVVKDLAVPPVEHRIALSSIRAPKLGRRDEKDEPYAYEAREFLRSRLIGRKVTVGIDYIRPLPNSTSESERVFASVCEGPNNVAIALVANGLATVMKHRGDDQDRSLYYDDLLQAEAAAARDKKGLHGDVTPPTRHINDISQSSAQAQAKQMFTMLQRAGRHQGIVQHVVNGARFKVLIPKQSCIVALALAGIRCPSTGRRDGEPGEPYGEEASMFSRDKCLQHDVELEITGQDKIGTMIGKLWLHKKDHATTLLAEGYARMSGRDATAELEAAQLEAQSKRLRTWENYDSELEAMRASEAVEQIELGGPAEAQEVTVVEMCDAVRFYVHEASAPKQLDLIGDRLAQMAPAATDSAWRPKIGDVCAAKFSADNCWYRARVEGRKADKCDVFFVDYGNSDTVAVADMRPLPSSVPSMVQCPAQAVEYKLAHIKLPRDDDLIYDAADLVQGILAANGGVVRAKIEYKERSGRHHVTLMDKTSGESISALLLRNGLAKLEKRKQDVEGLKDEQEAARKAHLNIWRYGDAADSDDEDMRFAQDVAKAKEKLGK
eukprot:CAMPEP_0206267944 /NCGR_PEP_ID=MMETSP0047_2-20121206/31432_1 /ASSEMBLY_ACC=CAM_ASM_000192 /TAXON_ID=195065 /ORGANISM="Chroomonas mesostigmatica_cf, Strain CCMP1168" /LENGTH=890 /DNA_ID=CAMNT_0053696207 /DNA_START=148 /DNA_END=2823 /DNA_ORIENTATION=+